MESVEKIFEANCNSEELLAWIALYQFSIKSQEDKFDEWLAYAKKRFPAREILKKQLDFLKNCETSNYTQLYRPAITKDLIILKLFQSFAISYGRGEKLVFIDFV